MNASVAAPATLSTLGLTREHRRVILGAALGSVFEWYDFFLYGALAAIIAVQFFAKADPATGQGSRMRSLW